MQALQAWCEKTVHGSWFQNLILFIIICSSALVGLETFDQFERDHSEVFKTLDRIVQVCFVVEILIRMLAYHPNYHRFFTSGWNIFDFTVVVLTFLPEVGTLAAIARLARILRITRIVEYSSELRLIVDTMFRSIPSMGHVLLLLGLLLYVYGVLGVHFFKDVDDKRWGHLGLAVWTMFQTITFENWVGVCDPVIEKHPWAWVFFLSFIIIGVFVGINLFVAVVMNNLQEVKEEHEQEKHAGEAPSAILDRVRALKAQVEEIENALEQQAKEKSAPA